MKKSILLSTLLLCVGSVFADDSSLNAEQTKQYQQEISPNYGQVN